MFDEPVQYDSIAEFMQNMLRMRQMGMYTQQSPQPSVSMPEQSQPTQLAMPPNLGTMLQQQAQQAQQPQQPVQEEGEKYGEMGGGMAGKIIGMYWGPIGSMIGQAAGKEVGGKIGMMIDNPKKNWFRALMPRMPGQG